MGLNVETNSGSGSPRDVEKRIISTSREDRATFFGTVYHKVSPRNQVAIPRHFLRTLEMAQEGPLLLLRWLNEEYLRMYTKRRFDEVMTAVKEKIRQAGDMSAKERREWLQRLTGAVEYIEPDSQGRFVLSGAFADLVGEEAAFCGADQHIEIWSAERRRKFIGADVAPADLATAEVLTEILDG
jgi:DNA-binding transcriptional regulator/RsmH inhibitor MraZ